jgi:glyoxylase-like metal-dependent hydrolase (beta-lactamase superfamily II)
VGVFLKWITESVAMIDTEALGERAVVAAYLVSGKENALIDMGYRSSAGSVMRSLSEIGIGNDDLHYLLPTHVHLDHSGSCGTLAQKFPGASIRVHSRGQPHLSDPTRLVKGATEVFGESMMWKFGVPDPISNKRVRALLDDEQVALGDGVTLRAIWTPGHAPHHLSYLFEEASTVFTGDAVGVYSPAAPVLVPTSPPPSFNLDKALESLERLRGLSPTRLLTPHFGPLEGASKRLEQNTLALLEWRKKLEKAMSVRSSVDEVVAALTHEIRKTTGGPSESLPEFVQTTVRVSVLGFLAYMEWKSRQVRS